MLEQRSQLIFMFLLVQISAHTNWLFGSKSVQGNTRLLCHDHLLPNPFQFIRPFCHSVLYSLATCNPQNKIFYFRFWENFVSQPCCSYFHMAYCIVKEGEAVEHGVAVALCTATKQRSSVHCNKLLSIVCKYYAIFS